MIVMPENILYRIYSTNVTRWKGWYPLDMSFFDVFFTDKACYCINKDDGKALSQGLQHQLPFIGPWLGRKIMYKQAQRNQEFQHLSLEERVLKDKDAHRFFYHEVRNIRQLRFLFFKPRRIRIETEIEKFTIVIPKDKMEEIFRFLTERCPGSFS